MTNRIIIFNDMDLCLASISIAFIEKKKTTSLVLAEIMKLSKETQDMSTANLSNEITKRLNISPELYRRSIHLLKKMNLIEKRGFYIILKDAVKPCEQIIITKTK